MKAIILVSLMLGGALFSGYMLVSQDDTVDELKEVITTEPDNNGYEQGWVKIQEIDLMALGENDPGSEGQSGFLSIFLLNYTGCTPANALSNNASDYSSWDNVSGYADSDSFSEDVESDAGFYFVVRARFNKTHCYR